MAELTTGKADFHRSECDAIDHLYPSEILPGDLGRKVSFMGKEQLLLGSYPSG
jgi:hypothetical protein